MFDDPIRPIHSVRAIEDVGAVGLRRKPTRAQLRNWLSFAKRVAKRAAPGRTEVQVEPGAEPQHPSDHQLDIEV